MHYSCDCDVANNALYLYEYAEVKLKYIKLVCICKNSISKCAYIMTVSIN